MVCRLIEGEQIRGNIATPIVVDVTRLCNVYRASFTSNGGVPVDLNEHIAPPLVTLL